MDSILTTITDSISEIELIDELKLRLKVTPYIIPYAENLVKAALLYRVPQAAMDFILDFVAIVDRESLWGAALRPKGPTGTGDWTPRHGNMPPDGLGWGRGLSQCDYRSTALLVPRKDGCWYL